MRKVGCVLAKIGLIVLFLALAATAVLAIELWPNARAVYTAAQDLRQLRQELHGWPTPAQVARLQSDVTTLDEGLGRLYDILRPTYPLLRAMAPLPRYGSALASLPDLALAGTRALHAGRLVLDVTAPAIPAQEPDHLQDLLLPLLTQIAKQDSQLAEAEAALREANAVLARVPEEGLPTKIDRWIGLVRELTYLGQRGIALLRLSPALLGAGGESVWLVLAQNNEELRPTGGFISAVGTVRVRDGEIQELAFVDSYRLYSPRVSYPPAPASMREALKTEILVFRDANWWPDVPTSARVLARFYEIETGTSVDGIIFLDLDAVRLFVEGMGGGHLADGTRITGNNLLPYFYQAWSNPTCAKGKACAWWTERKRFLNDMAAAMIARVQRNPRSIPPLRFARHLVQALDQRHLLLVPLTNAQAASITSTYGWDGALQPGAGDYLRVTDTNVGFNKANARVQLRISYTVDLRNTSAPVANLVLTYIHTSSARNTRCYQIAYYGLKYEDMQDRCYWNFLRVNVAQGAQLLERHGFRAGNVTVAAGDVGTTEFSGLIVVSPGERHQVSLRYILPQKVVRNGVYHLRVQKQPGMRSVPFSLTVRTEKGDLTNHFILESDVDIRVTLSGDLSIYQAFR